MVSPIKTFRKHRKVMLAVLTLVAMLSFVFLPVVGEILSLRGGSKNPVVVVTKKYGNLDEQHIRVLLWQRGRWLAFLQDLQRQVAGPTGGQFLFTAQKGGILFRDYEGRWNWVPAEDGLHLVVAGRFERLGLESEADVVETWLLSRKAREMGITISNKALNRFLGDLTADRVDAGQVKRILKSLGLSQSQLFDIMRNELSAMRLRRMLSVQMVGMTPGQRWDYYQRLNRTARIEAVPMDVEKLLDDERIPEPSEKDLKALFEEYKHKRSDPASPEPGFREPHYIAVEYFKAEMQDFLDPGDVSMAAIQAYYDEHKEKYRRLVFPDATVLPDKPPSPGQTPPKEKTPAETGKPEGGQAAPSKSEPLKQPPSKAEPSKSEPPKAAPSKSEPPKGKQDSPEPAGKAPTKASSGRNRPQTPVQLVSFQQEKEKQEKEKKESESPLTKPEAASPKPGTGGAKAPESAPEAASPKAGAGAAKSGSESPKTGADATKPPGEAPKPGAEAPKPGAEAPKPGAEAPKAGPGPEKPRPVMEMPKRELLTVDKVKDEIRSELAPLNARVKMAAALAPIQDEMGRFETRWTDYAALADEAKEAQAEPEPTDLGRIARVRECVAGGGCVAGSTIGAPAGLVMAASYAKFPRLKHFHTGWMTDLEAAQWPIAASSVEGSASFMERAFGQMPRYRAATSRDFRENEYLFWKSADWPERVPELKEEETRQRVVRAWKMIRARDLVAEAAETLAAKVRNSRKTLKEAVAAEKGVEVLTPPAFSWLSYGGLPPDLSPEPPGLGEVRGPDGTPIAGLGDRFMEKVFATAQGDADWAWNDPQTVAYVIRVVELRPPWNELYDSFIKTYSKIDHRATLRDESAANNAWKKELESEAGLRWNREPARGRVESADTDDE